MKVIEVKKKIDTKSGLKGIGSIIFRNEEKLDIMSDINPKVYYKKYILPYKDTLEMWYHDNMCLKIYFKIIMSTVWFPIFLKLKLPHKVLKKIPIERRQKLSRIESDIVEKSIAKN